MSGSATLLSEADGFFTLLPWDLSLDQARKALTSGTLGVVQDDQGRLVATILLSDLSGSHARDLREALPHLPPAVTVDKTVTFAQFAEAGGVTLLDLGPRAIVIVDGSRPVGVLPSEAVGAHLASHRYSPPANVMAGSGGLDDSILPGNPRTGLAPVICQEPGCGYLNWLAVYDQARPPWCKNPGLPQHRLNAGS